MPKVVQLAGGFNEDGTVDAVDYAVWRKNAAAAGGSDFATIARDYEDWRSNFEETLSSGKMSFLSGLAAMVVPEPPACLRHVRILANAATAIAL